jgi:hypothetical protein
MGDLYYDVSEERSASSMVTSRFTWMLKWLESVCILKLEGILQIIDLGRQKLGLVMSQ